MDATQYAIAIAINSLRGQEKQEKTVEYIDALMKMYENISNALNDDKRGGLNNVANKIDFGKLNQYLANRGFKSYGLPNDLSANGGYLIWPITLQPAPTYIHIAQIQLIKLFVLAGWRLHVIIGDCGKHSATVKDPCVFKKAIVSLLECNDIAIEDNTVTFLSKYFKRDSNRSDNSLLKEIDSIELLNTFHSIGDTIEWRKYWEYITKNYNKTKKDELQKRKVLSNI